MKSVKALGAISLFPSVPTNAPCTLGKIQNRCTHASTEGLWGEERVVGGEWMGRCSVLAPLGDGNRGALATIGRETNDDARCEEAKHGAHALLCSGTMHVKSHVR